MKCVISLILLFVLNPILCVSQADNIVESNGSIQGYVYDSETKAPLAYASIYSSKLNIGTISNVDGYFKLNLTSNIDTLVISYLGYTRGIHIVKGVGKLLNIRLKKNTTELSEVIVRSEKDDFLYSVLLKCARKNYYKEETAKAYFELKTFDDTVQVELVEGFYNVLSKGYDPIDLNLKAGRLAVRQKEDRMFLSLETSRAVIGLKMIDENQFFPGNPLEMSKRKMEKGFNLELTSKYYNDSDQLIYIIHYTPKLQTTSNFEGEIWVDIANFNVLKMTYQCKNATVHPFLPLWPYDSFVKVDLNITKTFEYRNQQMNFKHIDFCYQIEYQDLDKNLRNYSTTAILYTFENNGLFTIPKFNFSEPNIGDYRKISAFPYNDFFWTQNNELKLNTVSNANSAFYNSESSLRGEYLFHKMGERVEGDMTDHFYVRSKSKGLFEHPYVLWQGQRVIFREEEVPEKRITQGGNDSRDFGADMFNLSVKIFMDINEYNDSVQVITSTILDPFESYYYGLLGKENMCFINIYFDLVEIERQRLEEAILKSDRKIHSIEKLYSNSVEQLHNTQLQYYKETLRGTNIKALKKWNSKVFEKLGIDNFDMFKVEEGMD